MKKCTYCGRENQDEAAVCLECGTEFVRPTQSSQDGITAEEHRFWERMTFRQFAVLLVRLQALWLLFYVVLEVTYLPGYLSTFFPAPRFEVLPPEMKQTFYLALLRIILRVAVALAAFKYADHLLSWLVSGLTKQPPNPQRIE